MVSVLALVAAFFFALAATLQQKGALGVGEISFAHPKSILQLGRHLVWLYGTIALLAGYVFQAAALDNGRLSVVQPLLVTTIVFALPLGYVVTGQHVGRREVLGAATVVLGLMVFTAVGDPAGGKENAPGADWAIAVAVVCLLGILLMLVGSRGTLERKAGTYGAAAGLLYGLSAALWKPTGEVLGTDGLASMLTTWELYAFALAGLAAFLIQQVSLGTGRLAPSVATTSVMNPIVGVVVGVLILDERLSDPTWHKAVAWIGLGAALSGAIAVSLSRERAEPGDQPAALEPTEAAVAVPP